MKKFILGVVIIAVTAVSVVDYNMETPVVKKNPPVCVTGNCPVTVHQEEVLGEPEQTAIWFPGKNIYNKLKNRKK